MPPTVKHQKVVLRIDAEQRLVSGSTDLTIHPDRDFRELRLHCRQLRVLGVQVNGIATRSRWDDPLRQVAKLRAGQNDGIIGAFDKSHPGATARAEQGELVIYATPTHSQSKGKFEPMLVHVDFALRRPVAGAHFSESSSSAAPRAAHFFASARAPGPWGARLWLPCIDTRESAAPFDIFVTTHARHVTACCGVLKEHIVTAEPVESLDDNFANARISAQDWEAWSKTCAGVAEFVGQSRRLPRSVVEAESAKGSEACEPVTAREAWLAEWCTYQRLQHEQQKLPPKAVEMLEALTGWEWSALRTSHYHIKKSVLPSNLVLAAGPFAVLPDPELPHVTHLGVPGRGRLEELKHTVACFREIYYFIEGYAGSPAMPRRSYQQVFVDGFSIPHGRERRRFGDGWSAGYGCSLLSSDLLHGPSSIETTFAARQAMAEALASFCFGSMISAAEPTSRWIVMALARFLSLKYLGQAFGKTYYEFALCSDADETSRLCDDYPPISDEWCGNTASPELLEYMARRGTLILHMIERRVGEEALQQTIRSLAKDADGAIVSLKRRASRLTSEYFFEVLETKARQSPQKFVEKCAARPAPECWFVLRARLTGDCVCCRDRQLAHAAAAGRVRLARARQQDRGGAPAAIRGDD